jgi:hypothetical protein
MRYNMNIPILPGKTEVKPSTPASPPSFTDGCVFEIPREHFERFLSELVDLDLMPKYPNGFEYLSGPLNYIKFCKDSDRLAVKKNVPVLSRAQKDAGFG